MQGGLVAVLRVLKPVGELGHVERGDPEDVQEALRAPGLEVVLQGFEGGGAVQAQDGVRDVELVLPGGSGVCWRAQVVGREVAVKVREGLGELVGVLTRGRDYCGGRVELTATGRLVELEERVDPVHGRRVGAGVGLGEGLEPREVARVRGRVGREGLGVGRSVLPPILLLLMAGLREELGVLLEDLQVLLFFFGVC